MVTKVRDFSMIRGDTVQFTLTIKNTDEIPAEIWFSVRKGSDAPYTFQKSLDDGITTDNEDYLIRIAPEDTQELTPGRYLYDVELKFGADVYTVLMGRIELIEDVTRRPMT